MLARLLGLRPPIVSAFSSYDECHAMRLEIAAEPCIFTKLKLYGRMSNQVNYLALPWDQMG